MVNVDLRYLAGMLNISVSTVSRAVNNSHEVSAHTRREVMALADKLNYSPNLFGRGLKERKSKTIAIILPNLENDFFSSIISGIEAVVRKNGYHPLIYLTHERYETEVEIARHLLNGRVEGVLMSLSNETVNTSHLQDLVNKTPLVLFDRVTNEVKTPQVITDNFESGFKAGRHLLDKGCKHLLYLSSSQNLSTDKLRKEGFLEAISTERGGVKNSVVYCTNNLVENSKLIQSMFLSAERPDAVFASAENLALLCYEVCRDLRITIPKDVKLVSFSNSKRAPFYNPALTTITQPAFEMGEAAATVLFSILSRKTDLSDPELICLSSELIVRESSGGNLTLKRYG